MQGNVLIASYGMATTSSTPTAPTTTTTTAPATLAVSSTMTTVLWLVLLLLLDELDNLFRDPEVFNLAADSQLFERIGYVCATALWTYVVTANVNFRKAEELVTFRARLDYFSQNQVHPVVAGHKVAVQGLAILELYQHRVALCGRQKAERQLREYKIS